MFCVQRPGNSAVMGEQPEEASQGCSNYSEALGCMEECHKAEELIPVRLVDWSHLRVRVLYCRGLASASCMTGMPAECIGCQPGGQVITSQLCKHSAHYGLGCQLKPWTGSKVKRVPAQARLRLLASQRLSHCVVSVVDVSDGPFTNFTNQEY